MTFFVFLFSFWFLLQAVAPGIAADDTAELTLAALRLDITHPPGYPLLALVGKLFLYLPVGSPAFRMNLTGVTSGAVAVTLLYSTTRALLKRIGSNAFLPALLVAGLGLTLPVVFYQATQAEKYAPHLALAMVVIWAYVTERRGYLLAFALGLALAHHPMAIFLLPLMWAVKPMLKRPPELALILAFLLLPATLKVVYPAIRAPAALAEKEYSAWGEPNNARALHRYLTVQQYGSRFTTAPGTFLSRIAAQIAAYPAQMTWPILIIAIFGAYQLVRTDPRVAIPLLLVAPLHGILAGSIQLPSHLTPQFHLVPQFILLIGVAAGLTRLPCLVSPALLLTLALSGWMHASDQLPLIRKDRRTAVWDYNRSLLNLAPQNSLLLAGMDHDLFPLRYLTQVLRIRPDVTVLDTPFQTKYRSYRDYVARAAPGLEYRPLTESDPRSSLRALVRANGQPACRVFSGYLEAVLPGDLTFVGPLASHRERPCLKTSPERLGTVWRRLPLRALRARDARTARLKPTVGIYEIALSIPIAEAMRAEQLSLARDLVNIKLRLFPDLPSTYIEAGLLSLQNGDARSGAIAFERAIKLAPGMVDAYAYMVLLMHTTKSWEGLADLIAHARSTLMLAPTRELAEAVSALAGNTPASGAILFRRVLASHALREADALRSRGIVHTRRIRALESIAKRLDSGLE